MTLPVLPTYYYRDHFVEMLQFAERTYGEILTEEHRAFVACFYGLSHDAQCLLIRMVNRRGAIFNRALFRYAEISDIQAATDALMDCGHVRALASQDYSAFVACLTKVALLDGARAAGFGSEVRASWSKQVFVDFFVARIPFAVAVEHCGGESFVALADTRPIEFLLYLYFGKTAENLKNFALRDLGVLRTNRETSFSARFADAKEAHACFHYSQVLDRIEIRSAEICEKAAVDILEGPERTTEYATDLAGRAACQVGQFFERQGDKDLAERLYRFGGSAECRERLVRLLHARGDKSATEDLLRQMIDDPESDDEHLFAGDFYARKFGDDGPGCAPTFCGRDARSRLTTRIAEIPRRAWPECCGVRADKCSLPRTRSGFRCLDFFLGRAFRVRPDDQWVRLDPALPARSHVPQAVCHADRC
ncbi:hypothetical protein [Bradyrhizobium sp. BR 1433]|uniref:hypothetical protein n=1 Tax=Bradyrhizobium sp. BR 1433 TaxID=3447967 RepID=UPI003EE71136